MGEEGGEGGVPPRPSAIQMRARVRLKAVSTPFMEIEISERLSARQVVVRANRTRKYEPGGRG